MAGIGEPLRTEQPLALIQLPKENTMPENHSDPTNSSVKPAYKSTEFWLKVIALVIGAVLTSGILDAKDAQNAKIMDGLVAISGILAALGYGAMRTSAKNTAAEGATALAIEKIRAEAAPAAIDLLKSAGVGVSVPTPPASS